MADLLALSRAEQENAKRFFRWRLVAHLGTLAVSVVALFFENEVSYVLAAAAVLTELAAWWCRSRSEGLHALADRGLRRALLIKALGGQKNDLDASALEVEFSRYARENASEWDDPKYWATKQRPGPDYLRANMQESAFYSSALYREAASRAALRLGLTAVVAVTTLVVLLLLDTGDTGVTAARVITVLMAVLVSTDELSVLRAYRDGHEVAKRTCERLQHADLGQTAQALALFADYATATTSAPPIPTSLYKKKHDEIEQAWRAMRRKR